MYKGWVRIDNAFNEFFHLVFFPRHNEDGDLYILDTAEIFNRKNDTQFYEYYWNWNI